MRHVILCLGLTAGSFSCEAIFASQDWYTAWQQSYWQSTAVLFVWLTINGGLAMLRRKFAALFIWLANHLEPQHG